MNIQTTQQNGTVTIILNGKLDTFSSNQAMVEIDNQLAAYSQIKSLVCDMSGVDYISSSGLRIMLKLAKQYKDFTIIEVKPDVYEVFNMTGFTKMMPIKKALRQLSIDGCTEIGRGGVGIVYRIDDETIIKVFREGTTLDTVQTEIMMSKEAFVFGMPTAISFDIVRVGTQYGLVYELLRAETLSECLSREPERIDEFALLYADVFRQMHNIEVPATTCIPSALERQEQAIRHIGRYFDTASIDLLLEIASYIPPCNRLLHCDLQAKNAMLQNGEVMLIDMGEVAYGHPVIDLAYAHSSMVSFTGDYEKVIGIPRDLGKDLYQRMLSYYFKGMGVAETAHRIKQIEAVACIRNFSWLSLSDSFPEALVRECQENFAKRVTSRKDYLLEVCQTLSDWTV